VGDSLYFYYGAWSGKSPALFCNMYAGGATGIAKLRRDGFSSMDADTKGGILITRPVEFTGNYLFVNVATSGGELTVEILNKDNKPIPPYTRENCIPVRTDKTLQSVRWRFGDTLSGLETKTVKFKFYLQSGSLYSFWVSPDRTGASYGYVAAGGPGFTGNRDTVGIGAY
jgi:hypothetical protein